MIYDIHTHHHPALPGEAIVQLTPDAFCPQPGHFYSVGLHPWNIRNDWRTQMAGLLVRALHPQVVMIGETGLPTTASLLMPTRHASVSSP